MSHKLICLFAIFTLCAIVVTTEARGGRGRSGSLGSAFYRRSHKKQTSSGGGSSRRKIISASPVHTDYTNSMLAAQATDEKFARHRSRHRHDNHKSTSSLNTATNHKNQKHDSAHENHNSHTSMGKQSQHNTHSLYPLGSSGMQHGTHAANPYVTHNWGGHQLPPGHVYVTQPSSIPTNAVYYAQPPMHTNTDDSADFALGYLVGRSLTRTRHHHHHHYEQQPQAQAINETQTKIVIVETQANPTGVAPATNQTNYWPTETEVALAPLNNSLIPNGVSQSTEPIFKSPPIVSAQKLTAENATFELPSATAAPPESPPANGIICMPWDFSETDPSNPEKVVVVQKTICFPAPPAPPTTPSAPIAGDIDVDLPTTTATTAASS